MAFHLATSFGPHRSFKVSLYGFILVSGQKSGYKYVAYFIRLSGVLVTWPV